MLLFGQVDSIRQLLYWDNVSWELQEKFAQSFSLKLLKKMNAGYCHVCVVGMHNDASSVTASVPGMCHTALVSLFVAGGQAFLVVCALVKLDCSHA